jgi:RsiW-degrading membrane proteinase PrsW (M82 family)
VSRDLALEIAGLVVAVTPIVLLVMVFRRADSARPEPHGEVIATMALGFLVCIPAAALEVAEKRLLGSWASGGGRFLDAYFVAAFTEESAKMAVVFFWPWRRRNFDEVMDGVLYTAAASLGFGLLENLIYVNPWFASAFCALPGIASLCGPEHAANSQGVGGVVLGVVRAITAVPMHAIASGIMGYFIGRARFDAWSPAEDTFDDLPELLPVFLPRTVSWCILGLLAAVTVHGTYDWAVFAMGSRPIIFIVLPLLLGVATFALVRLIRHALLMDEARLGSGRRSSLVVAILPPRRPSSPPPAQ